MAYGLHQYLPSTWVLCARARLWDPDGLLGRAGGTQSEEMATSQGEVQYLRVPLPAHPGLLLCTCCPWPPRVYFAQSTEAKLGPGSGWTGSGCVQHPQHTPALFSPLTDPAVRDGSSGVGKLRLVAEGGRFDVRVQALTSSVVLSCLGIPALYEPPLGSHG